MMYKIGYCNKVIVLYVLVDLKVMLHMAPHNKDPHSAKREVLIPFP